MTDENHKPLRYRVKYGYQIGDFLRVQEGPDLERALYAMLEHVPVSLDGRVIHGKTILAIEPDYHHYTGWNPGYQPKSPADFQQILRDCPSDSRFDLALNATKLYVQGAIAAGTPERIGNSKPRATPVERLQ